MLQYFRYRAALNQPEITFISHKRFIQLIMIDLFLKYYNSFLLTITEMLRQHLVDYFLRFNIDRNDFFQYLVFLRFKMTVSRIAPKRTTNYP